MDPVTIGMLVGQVGVPIITGIIGRIMSDEYSEEEREQWRLALEEYAAIAPPEHRDLIAREVARSQMGAVRRNPQLDAMMDEVQGRYMEVARDGESARGRADYEQSAMDSAQLERSQREGAVSRADALGLGPEAAFSDALLAGQGGADRERMAGLQRAAFNEENRMGALGAAGSMAANRSATQWQQDAQAAEAQDELNMFNVGQFNNMQQFNEGNRYRNFNAQLDLANARSGVRQRHAGYLGDKGQQVREDWANVGRGVGGMLGAGVQYLNSTGMAQPGGAGGAMPQQQVYQQPTAQQATPFSGASAQSTVAGSQQVYDPKKRKAR
jgi:hypothetical protein